MWPPVVLRQRRRRLESYFTQLRERERGEKKRDESAADVRIGGKRSKSILYRLSQGLRLFAVSCVWNSEPDEYTREKG